jgi:hypothetical protein
MSDHQPGASRGGDGRVVESIPNRPLTGAELLRLDAACRFVAAVDGPDGVDGGPPEAGTETLVVTTAGRTRLLRRDAGHGWVVGREREHRGGERPRAVGVDLYAEAAPDARLSVAEARTVLGLNA